MFLVNKLNNVVVVVSNKIKETKYYFVANGINYVKIDLELINEDLPEGFEVGKTLYTADTKFTKTGDGSDGTEMGEATEETETETEKVDTNPEAPEGN